MERIKTTKIVFRERQGVDEKFDIRHLISKKNNVQVRETNEFNLKYMYMAITNNFSVYYQLLKIYY